MQQIFTQMEARWGRFAIPGLVQILAVFQLLTYVLVIVSSKEAAVVFLSFLELIPERVWHGEVWRVFTHIFIPRNISPIWVLIGTIFLFWIGRGLDERWGAFRVNLYFLGGVILLGIGALVFGFSGGGLLLFQTLLFAFAMFYPNEEILLFFVIPIKVKWIAILAAGALGLGILRDPSMFWQALFANLNFLVAFGPGLVQSGAARAKTMERRGRFEAAKVGEDTFFHQCGVCGKTERDDPRLEFRVNDAGEEICEVCRGKGG